MFVVTFLGHQGWLLQTERACIVVDPLLSEQFGQVHALQYQVFPPRVFTPSAFPFVDAVVLTHEHDDHFDIPSLNQLDRKIPIFLSARSSIAAYKILAAMGFTVTPLVPGNPIEVLDLQILPLCGDHLNTNSGDEWDTLPLLIRQAEGAGSFFSMIDCTLTTTHIAFARNFMSRPGVVSWTNNAQDWTHMSEGVAERVEATPQYVQNMRAGFDALRTQWGPPGTVIMSAGGYSFYGDRKWLNRRVFCVEPERVVKAMSTAYPQQRFLAGRPGHTVYMQDNQVKRVEQQAPFLTTAPPADWPLRDKSARTMIPDYAPATARCELTTDELERLKSRLNEFAGALVGSLLFRNLYSILDLEFEGRRGTFAFVLRTGEKADPLVFAYNPSACIFEQVVVPAPREVFVAGLTCWATDLLAVFEGELGSIALSFGRAQVWNALPGRLRFDVFAELQKVSHPLRRPAEYLRIYERILKSCPNVPPTLRHRV